MCTHAHARAHVHAHVCGSEHAHVRVCEVCREEGKEREMLTALAGCWGAISARVRDNLSLIAWGELRWWADDMLRLTSSRSRLGLIES